MAQLIQVWTKQIIDKRIAKFSSKGSPLKPIVSQKDTRNVKLKPIEILNAAKGKNEHGTLPTTQKVRRIKVQAANYSKPEDMNQEIEPNTVELPQNPDVQEFLNHSGSFENTDQSYLEEIKEN